MSTSETTATYMLETIRPRFEAEGFDVFLHPSPSILPPFMKDYRPDAIAIGPQKKIAIQVVRPVENAEKITQLQKLIDQHSDWELHVVRVPPGAPKVIDVASRSSIDGAIGRVLELRNGGQLVPALVMSWAVVEAIGRALLPEKFGRPQTPGRLVELLAYEGYLAPDDADGVRPLIALRNEAVHGALNTAVDGPAVDQFIAILRKLAEYVK
jgi:REase_AHJR-like